jgi:GNAT superfamily N-acetyltransferase
VAYWQSPGEEDISVSLKALGKLLPLLLTRFPIGYYRASRANGVIPQTDALHKKHASKPHYYLDNLGVLPSAQGQGYSSRLIRPILARADEQGVMVYTDTVTPANVPLYEHFGFEMVEERRVAGTPITVFALLRAVRDRR